MTIHPDMLEQARRFHQAGELAEAERAYQQILQANGQDAEVWYQLGDVVLGQCRRALELRSGYGEVYNNLGLALIELRRSAEAVVILQQGVRLRPVAESHNNLGLALADLGRFAEAEACYREALRLNPAFVDAHGNLANLYKEQGRL